MSILNLGETFSRLIGHSHKIEQAKQRDNSSLRKDSKLDQFNVGDHIFLRDVTFCWNMIGYRSGLVIFLNMLQLSKVPYSRRLLGPLSIWWSNYAQLSRAFQLIVFLLLILLGAVIKNGRSLNEMYGNVLNQNMTINWLWKRSNILPNHENPVYQRDWWNTERAEMQGSGTQRCGRFTRF